MNDDLHGSLSNLLEPLPPPPAMSRDALVRGRRRRLAKLAGTGATTALVLAAAVTVGLSSSGTPRSDVVVGSGATGRPSAAPTATVSPAMGPAVQLVLEPDGLGYLAGSASVRHLGFADADPAAVDDLLTRALGPGTRTPLPDCGPAVVVIVHGAFSLYADGSRFVGWSTVGSAATRPHLSTADGVGLGATLTELRQAYGALRVTTGTLGPEWSVPGGLAGGLDGTASSSRVVRIGAGSTCLAR